MANETSLSTEIYLARTQILSQIISKMQTYLELENVDLSKSSFLSYIANTLSTLSSNLLFYQSSIYKEYFLTKAQLPETVYNLASTLGYTPSAATYAIAELLITVPLNFTDSSVSFTIPDGSTADSGGIFYADNIEFRTYYNTEITVTNNSSVTIDVTQEGKLYHFPVNVDTTSEDHQFQFVLPVRQYKITEQIFGIDDNLERFQFTSIDVPIEGKLYSMEVFIRSQDSPTETEYEEKNSLYLMSSTTYGYVSRPASVGRTLYFGNGLLGVQPESSSIVRVRLFETEGADGNVIAGSIIKGNRIYTSQSGVTQIINYTVTNPSPAYNGTDEEALSDIRNNAITNLTALGRLVSELDYTNAGVIIPNSPIADKSLSVLKRSDIRYSEIQLFTTINFDDDIVPTNNVYYEVGSSTTYIPRGTEITQDGNDYYTLFDITVESTKDVAYYHYILSEIDISPSLVSVPNVDLDAYPQLENYNFYVDSLNVSSSGVAAEFDVSYYSQEDDFSDTTCLFTITNNSSVYEMVNVPGSNGGHFTLTISPYTTIPEGELTCLISVYKRTSFVSEYSTTFTFRRNLNAFMLSNVVDATSTIIIYDIPVVEKTYYDSIDQTAFELQTLQLMLTTLTMKNYRMLTDFTNVKFCKTKGTMVNLQFNETTKTQVTSIEETLPLVPTLGSRYIVSYGSNVNKIATCTNTSPVSWTYVTPRVDDTVYVTSEGKKYIYTGFNTGFNWIYPSYEIPLKIELEVFKTLSSIDSTVLAGTIKTAIYDEFSSRFGPHATIYRSEIIDVVQGITGVQHCHLVSPESNICFNVDLDNMSQNELLIYTPEYIYFTEDDITITVFQG